MRDCDIKMSYRSDHSIVYLNINFENITHGKGLWKFNNWLLYDQQYLETINNKINEVKIQYAVPIYNAENIDIIDDGDLQFVIDDQLFLETLLMEIRGKSISYSSFKKKNENTRELELVKEIESLENNVVPSNVEYIQNLKSELEKLRD